MIDRVIIPQFESEELWKETEILGCATWLWFKASTHQDAMVWQMMSHLLPMIKLRQFALFFEENTPVGYVSWAYFDEASQSRYLQDPKEMLTRFSDWNSGKALWVIDWMAPLGHTRAMQQLLKTRWFANTSARSLYHHGRRRGARVMNFHGKNVSAAQRAAWVQQSPEMMVPGT